MKISKPLSSILQSSENDLRTARNAMETVKQQLRQWRENDSKFALIFWSGTSTSGRWRNCHAAFISYTSSTKPCQSRRMQCTWLLSCDCLQYIFGLLAATARGTISAYDEDCYDIISTAAKVRSRRLFQRHKRRCYSLQRPSQRNGFRRGDWIWITANTLSCLTWLWHAIITRCLQCKLLPEHSYAADYFCHIARVDTKTRRQLPNESM